MTRIDVDDTSRCPEHVLCGACGGGHDVQTVTLQVPVGVLCAGVCATCLDAGQLPRIAGWRHAAERVMAHCEHLGCDLDQMAAAIHADRAATDRHHPYS